MKKMLQSILLGSVMACAIGVGQQAYGQIVQIGTSFTTSSIYLPNPISIGGSAASGYKAAHHQIIYTVAQLNGLGVTGPKYLDSIAWQVAQVASAAIKNYNIKGKMFTPDSFYTTPSSTSQFETIGFTPLVSKPTYLPPGTGFQWLAFSTPLFWNGVDNIMLDICCDTSNTLGPNGKVYVSNITNMCWGGASCTGSGCGTTGVLQWLIGSGVGPYALPNIKMSFRAAPACSGVPASLTVAPAGPFTNCITQSQLLEVANIPTTAGVMQWQKSFDGINWQNVAVGSMTETSGKGVDYLASYASGVPYVSYHVVFKCPVTGDSVVSNAVTLNAVFTPVYAALPYTQDFESWINECNTTDAPDSSWVNSNAMGVFSWRREDQGASANWVDLVPYNYYPLSSTGNHSARIQVSKGPGKGSLFLYANCAGPNAGGKELRFDYYCRTTGATTNLKVYCSVDSGATFTLLSTYNAQGVSATWQPQVVQIPSNSPKTIIKFEANSGGYSVGDFDMGIDNVRLLQACTDAPTVGIVDSTQSACLGSGFTLGLIGSSSVAGLSWLWEQSTNGISWDTIPGGNVEHPSVAINGPTWYRCILACTNSGLFNISDPRLIYPDSFYHCYCNSTSTIPNPGFNIGNLTFQQNPNGNFLINNGLALPTFNNQAASQHHSDFTNLPPADIYLNTIYKIHLAFIDASGPPNNPSMPNVTTKVYIDWNQNGTFEASEKVWVHLKASGAANIADSGLITVPATALLGTTGMRVISDGTTDTSEAWGPCSSYGNGETEDYLVRVWAAPCTGGSIAGTISASDTVSCPGYPFTLTNTNFDSTSGMIHRIWQQSTDGTNYTDIANSDNLNSITLDFTVPMWYRVQSSCDAGGAATTSNSVKINKRVVCYCASYADGGFAGAQDSSDIGGFIFANISHPLVGGHLNNALAVNRYSNYTSLAPAQLWADSTYSFSIVHTILRNDHMDAKITMFIDYNANGVFDIPEERVYSDKSTISSWQKTGTITIPSNVVLNTPTGLRVIINNDTAANVASDTACGVYTSGETEDYVVSFKKVVPPVDTSKIGINAVNNGIQSIHIFPNPATGTVSIEYKGADLKSAAVKVESITGQLLEQKAVGRLKEGELIQVNLSRYAKGIYFITLESQGSKVTGKVVLQ
jgi:hypothetical protein